jgi:hypothetical protein
LKPKRQTDAPFAQTVVVLTSRIVLLAILLAGTACNQLDGCPADLGVKLTPRDTTIGVGDQFQAQLTLLLCGGKTASDSLTWTSSDIDIAVVGAHTGIVIGVRPGTAFISVSGKLYGNLDEIQLTVH